MIPQRLDDFAFIVGEKLGGHDANIMDIEYWGIGILRYRDIGYRVIERSML